jgi:hypothetical protein
MHMCRDGRTHSLRLFVLLAISARLAVPFIVLSLIIILKRPNQKLVLIYATGVSEKDEQTACIGDKLGAGVL